MTYLAAMLVIAGVFTAFLFRRGGAYNPIEVPPPAPVVPQDEPLPPEPLPEPYDFSTPQKAWHSVRVICDEMGLTYDEKNLICACIYQESRFKNTAVGRNEGSTDYGIVQVNDYWHIGKGKTFPSVEYVVGNPEKMVRWMITCYKRGQLNLWSSYKKGHHLQWLPKTSEMWLLVENAPTQE